MHPGFFLSMILRMSIAMHNIVAVLIFFGVYSCSSRVIKKDRTSSHSSKNVEYSNGEKGTNPDQPPADYKFTPVVNNTPLLPFLTRIKKLAHLVNKDFFKEDLTEKGRFGRLIKYRYILGDYNHSQGISEQLAWGELQINRWLEGVQLFCESSEIKTQYPFPGGFEDLIVGAYGRLQQDRDQDLFDKIKSSSLSADEKSTVACLVVTSSLEFQTQRPTTSRSLRGYLSRISSVIMQRSLLKEELEMIDAQGQKALRTIILKWLETPDFFAAAAGFAKRLFHASGQEGGIDYNLPAYLLKSLTKRKRPYGEFITATKCRNKQDQEIPCDTGAPFNAGALTTRAFLASNAGPYNLSRAGLFLESFACLTYPMGKSLEPQLAKEDLIPIFAKETGQGFGNGTNCYLCHSQFGKHTQLFVKFDGKGKYTPGANGLQDQGPTAPPGHSTNGTFTSHFSAPKVAALEASEFFGKPVKNIADAAKELVGSDHFIHCAVERFLAYYLDLKDTTALAIKKGLFDDITQQILASGKTNPSKQDILASVLLHPAVIDSFVDN